MKALSIRQQLLAIADRLDALESRAEAAEAERDRLSEDLKGANLTMDAIEALFPNWKGYRDLADCINVTLHELRNQIESLSK